MSASLVDIQPSDPSKRTWLIASSCAGAVGVGAVAVPFISSFEPSERAKAAGAAVEVDISGIKPGEKLTVEWRGKPVWILRRTPEQLATLPKNDAELADPQSKRKPDEFTPVYARNEARSNNPDSANSQFFIMFAEGGFLDGNYTVLGKVDDEGMFCVDRLERGEPPATPDKMVKVTVQ